MVIAKKIVYIKNFDEAIPATENCRVEEEELSDLKDGEFLFQAVYVSADVYVKELPPAIGAVMSGSQVARIIASKSKSFPVGKYVVSNAGWRTHTIETDNQPDSHYYATRIVPFEADVPLSLALGMLGMPGNTATVGLLEVCKPKAGETVITNSAAGSIGSHVGQIAKIKGCKVIGIAGSDEKGDWLKSIGFDHVINYKTQDLDKALSEVAPNGIDCYFDNVGGEMSTTVMKHMNDFGRIAICGALAYSDKDGVEPKATMVQRAMLFKRLTMTAFWVDQCMDKWDETILQNLRWIQEGKLKYSESVTEGFEKLPEVLEDLFKGRSIGKAIVKV